MFQFQSTNYNSEFDRNELRKANKNKNSSKDLGVGRRVAGGVRDVVVGVVRLHLLAFVGPIKIGVHGNRGADNRLFSFLSLVLVLGNLRYARFF